MISCIVPTGTLDSPTRNPGCLSFGHWFGSELTAYCLLLTAYCLLRRRPMKTPFRSLLFILLGAGFALPVQCGLIGETINIDRLIPSEGFDYDVFEGQSGAYTVGVSSPLSLSTGNNEYASTTNTDLIVDFGPFGGYGGGIPDHEIVFSGLYAGTGLSINGVTIGTNNVPGLIASDITFTANSVTVAIGNINYTGGQV